MTESKPAEQYNAVPDPDNGLTPVAPTIDEQSRQNAMARAMIENEKQARVQACAAEIDKSIHEILDRHNCIMAFTYEVNVFPSKFRAAVNDEVKQPHIGIRPIAMDKA